MYICVSLPVNEPYQTLVSLHQSVLCGYNNVTFFFSGGGGWGLICLIVLFVKLLTGFEAFGPPVKDFSLGVSVVILDGASVVQILKGVGVSSKPKMFLKRYVVSTFCAVDRVDLLGGQFKQGKIRK